MESGIRIMENESKINYLASDLDDILAKNFIDFNVVKSHAHLDSDFASILNGMDVIIYTDEGELIDARYLQCLIPETGKFVCAIAAKNLEHYQSLRKPIFPERVLVYKN
ncbi:MAG: hypothetical protein KKA64_00020 [Nanoarchaeota archaeon]|nr:hypothetical protein [Nanoarchaeota archaeon]